MTLTPSRPVPAATSPEQQRLEVELLMGEPVLGRDQLRPELLGNTGLPLRRWQELGACPASPPQGGQLDVAVPSRWGEEERRGIGQNLAGQGLRPRFQLAMEADIQTALREALATPVAPSLEAPAAEGPGGTSP